MAKKLTPDQKKTAANIIREKKPSATKDAHVIVSDKAGDDGTVKATILKTQVTEGGPLPEALRKKK